MVDSGPVAAFDDRPAAHLRRANHEPFSCAISWHRELPSAMVVDTRSLMVPLLSRFASRVGLVYFAPNICSSRLPKARSCWLWLTACAAPTCAGCAGCPGNLLPPSPPAEKTSTRHPLTS